MRIIYAICFFILVSPAFAVHTILLKNGKSVKGTITNQNVDNVEMNTEKGGHVVIPKKSVLKVIYKDIAEADEAKIRKEEEEKRDKEKAKILAEKKEELLRKEKELEKEENSKPVVQNQLATTSFRDTFLLGGSKQNSIQVASLEANCQAFQQYSQYFYLFGTFPFNEPKWPELLPKDNRTVRIRQTATNLDIVISVLGAFFTTVTRKTIQVEVCEGTKQNSPSAINTDEELKKAEEKYELEQIDKDLEHLKK
ncbi:hypothetical protein P3G55_17785 [Leptospira sp. 96542]|nr:hypothetical protein [Leptospira sp. 96542]